MKNKSTNPKQMENYPEKVKSKKARKVRAAAAKAPTLEFAEPDKAGWRIAEGKTCRFCIGASRHHGTEFGLYIRTPEMSRFKFLAKFEAFNDALAEAEKVDATTKLEPSTS